jgi:hypothetical protein
MLGVVMAPGGALSSAGLARASQIAIVMTAMSE